jgi:hypothetical protein
MSRKVLVIDVGGTHIKILATGQKMLRKVDSGPKMTARAMCAWVNEAAKDWPHDVATIGFPGPVVYGKPIREPFNLGKGWVGFDYRDALGCPVKMMNDAAIQGAWLLPRRTHAVSRPRHRSRFSHDCRRTGRAHGTGPSSLPTRENLRRLSRRPWPGTSRKKEMALLCRANRTRVAGRFERRLCRPGRWERSENEKAPAENAPR